MDGFERCMEKLDKITAQLEAIKVERLFTPQMIVLIWVSFFFLPAMALIGSIIWLSR